MILELFGMGLIGILILWASFAAQRDALSRQELQAIWRQRDEKLAMLHGRPGWIESEVEGCTEPSCTEARDAIYELASYDPIEIARPCRHESAIDVETFTGEIVARLCPDCDTQLEVP